MRAFIVGNGPSLRKHLERGDFDLLQERDEVTFAMNKIHLLYELGNTSWVPTNYIFFEAMGRGDKSNEWVDYVSYWIKAGVRCYLDETFRPKLLAELGGINRLPTYWKDQRLCDGVFDNVVWVRRWICHAASALHEKRPESWHLPEICCYGGSMNIAAQLAFMLGYEPVYLIGCDLGFRNDKSAAEDPNHFHPDYWTQDDFPLSTRDQTLQHMHSIIKKEFETKGRHIYNAGIGGHLDVYERVDLREVLDAHPRT